MSRGARPTRTGRWTVISKRRGKWLQRTFDTPDQAEAWIDQMIKENSSWHAGRLGQPGALTLAELAESMGHASTQMTLDRYVHPEPDVDKRNAGAAMWAAPDTYVVPLHRRVIR